MPTSTDSKTDLSVIEVIARAGAGTQQVLLRAAAEHEDMARDGFLRAAAESRWTTPPAARAIVADPDVSVAVLTAVAANPATDPDVLTQLRAHPNRSVAQAALWNRSCSYAVLRDHPDGNELAHPDCPPDILAAAARTPAGRRYAYRHPHLPTWIRQAAVASAKAADWEADMVDVVALLGNPALTAVEAGTLLSVGREPTLSHASAVNSIWADNPNADPGWLGELYAHRPRRTGPADLTDHIAENPSTPPAVLTEIAGSNDWYRRQAVLGNPACPPAALHAALDRTEAHQTSPISTETSAERWAVAVHPAADVDILRRLRHFKLSDDLLLDFILRHATTAAQAQVLLVLGPTWAGSAADLLAVAGQVSAPAAEPEPPPAESELRCCH